MLVVWGRGANEGLVVAAQVEGAGVHAAARGGGAAATAGGTPLRAARPARGTPGRRYKINTCFAKSDFDLSTPKFGKFDLVSN